MTREPDSRFDLVVQLQVAEQESARGNLWKVVRVLVDKYGEEIGVCRATTAAAGGGSDGGDGGDGGDSAKSPGFRDGLNVAEMEKALEIALAPDVIPPQDEEVDLKNASSRQQQSYPRHVKCHLKDTPTTIQTLVDTFLGSTAVTTFTSEKIKKDVEAARVLWNEIKTEGQLGTEFQFQVLADTRDQESRSAAVGESGEPPAAKKHKVDSADTDNFGIAERRVQVKSLVFSDRVMALEVNYTSSGASSKGSEPTNNNNTAIILVGPKSHQPIHKQLAEFRKSTAKHKRLHWNTNDPAASTLQLRYLLD